MLITCEQDEAMLLRVAVLPRSQAPPVGDRQLNLAPLRATNWKNIQLHLAKY